MSKTKVAEMISTNMKKIDKLKEELKTLPAGHLLCLKNGKYTRWEQVTTGRRRRIPKKNVELAIKLARKKYLEAELEDLELEQKWLESCMAKMQKQCFRLDRLLENELYYDLLEKGMCGYTEEQREWMTAEFPSNPKNTEDLRHRSLSGHVLRSKSEMMIDNALYTRGIPFRYECELELGSATLYPDFMIMHPDTGEIILWEHFGLIEMEDYAAKAFSKLHLLNECGYHPMINLIMTFETAEHPLDIATIEHMIEMFF